MCGAGAPPAKTARDFKFRFWAAQRFSAAIKPALVSGFSH
jgi:hypothetical protein